MDATGPTIIVQNSTSSSQMGPVSKQSVTTQIDPSPVLADPAAVTTMGTNTDRRFGDNARSCSQTCPRWPSRQVFHVEEAEVDEYPGND